MKTMLAVIASLSLLLAAPADGAPLARGQGKFLGSANSPQQAPDFARYWNKVTPENAGKWGEVEAVRDQMDWAELDRQYTFAKRHGFPFQMHVMVWGNQQPEWIKSLPVAEQREEIEEWFAAVAQRYPDLDFVEVVNEPLHDPPDKDDAGGGHYLAALGGSGTSGWDWVLEAFRLGRHYFPRAQLLINDYNITNKPENTRAYLEIIHLLQREQLLDGIGVQAHSFATTTEWTMETHRANLDALAATGLPIYVTEMDIDGVGDAEQLASFQRVFPVFWEHPGVRGVTLWGYRPGLWRDKEGAALLHADGGERPALQWLRRYVRHPARYRPPPPSLKASYRDDFLLGVAVNDDIVQGRDPASLALIDQHFNAVTAENVMKAEVLHPRPDRWDFSAADAFVEFARRHKQFVVGHTLVWHNQTPAWFFQDAQGQPNTREAQLERMRGYIQTVAGRYAGKVDAWDVVNEVIDDDGHYRDTAWVRAVGDGDLLVQQAFRYAQQYAPGTELYYNDFNAWRPAKRDGIVRMVRKLQAAGIRIDGIGMQGHWGLHYPARADIEAAIDAFAALGLKVMITELDVDVLPLTREGQVTGTALAQPQFQLPEFERYLDPYPDGLPEEVQKQLTDRYAELFRIFHRKRAAIARVSLWGVHDGMSWKNDYPVPHRTNYPLLFDRQRRPKPALDAVLAVLTESTESTGPVAPAPTPPPPPAR